MIPLPPGRRAPRFGATLAPLLLLAAGIAAASPADPEPARSDPPRDLPPINRAILEGARRWLEQGFRYDASYFAIDYPGGDIPVDRGACVDLVVRALRHAGIDLQRLIHEDRRARGGAYRPAPPPDPNLDHRRCANHVVYLRENARALTTRTDRASLKEWLPGDLVYYGRSRAWHAGIVSDRVAGSGLPYIIDSHQDGRGVSEKFLVTRWAPILAHFRIEDRPAPRSWVDRRPTPPGR